MRPTGQLIVGALGENAAGTLSKDVNLGLLGNTIGGATGGGVGEQILNAILGPSGTGATSSLDIGTIASALAS